MIGFLLRSRTDRSHASERANGAQETTVRSTSFGTIYDPGMRNCAAQPGFNVLSDAPLGDLLRSIGTRLIVLSLLIASLGAAESAQAAPDLKKSIWGPSDVDGVSQFPIYKDLGVGLYQTGFYWSSVAPTKPKRPTDPNDPAYRWPDRVDFVLEEARKYKMEVSLLVSYSPAWANGGRSREWAPTRPQDYADFLEAASKRYPAVRHWMIWGEPSREANFKPMTRTAGLPRLTRENTRGIRIYSRILDAAYVSLKKVRRRNLVIGGNTHTGGAVPPRDFIRGMSLGPGPPPRMDLYGHNAFTNREPDLSGRNDPVSGYADFSDLDTLAGWLDRRLTRRGQRRLKIFVSEFTVPTGHPNSEFNFYVTPRKQARWLRSAFRITRSYSRIYTLGWFKLYDEEPCCPIGTHGDDVHRGLLDYQGLRKPSYEAYKRG